MNQNQTPPKPTPPEQPSPEGLDETACSALFDLLMEQIDAARKRSDSFEKQCFEENDLVEACKHARVSNVLWHIYHYGLHIAAHPPGCKICEFEEGWEKPFCEACGKIFLSNEYCASSIRSMRMECQKCGGHWVSPENAQRLMDERDQYKALAMKFRGLLPPLSWMSADDEATALSFDSKIELTSESEVATSCPRCGHPKSITDGHCVHCATACSVMNNARYCKLTKEWRIPASRCLACSDSLPNSVLVPRERLANRIGRSQVGILKLTVIDCQ